MFLPHIIAFRDDSKSSSVRMMLEWFLATDWPVPIDSPTSEFDNALRSVILEPVTATLRLQF